MRLKVILHETSWIKNYETLFPTYPILKVEIKKKNLNLNSQTSVILNDKIKKIINKKEEDWVVGGWNWKIIIQLKKDKK
jgi:hypothetical protein